MKSISVIMPVLNEGRILEDSLAALGLSAREELIVVDGGSADDTLAIARRFTDNVMASSAPGRARQMNLGARAAKGDILLFLHADCRLPSDAFPTIRSALEDGRVLAGAFDIRVDHASRWFRLIERCANARSRLTRVPYGDQGLFLARATFERLGGFADLPLMEDIEIARRLRRMGRIYFSRPPVLTSARRWMGGGIVRTTLRDWALAVSYAVLGVSAARLARHYGNAR